MLDEPNEEVRALTATGRLRANADFGALAELDTANICVPTPLRKTKDPDLSYIVAAVDDAACHLHPGQLIILESTTYPSTVQGVVEPKLEERGLRAGRDFFGRATKCCGSRLDSA